MRKCFSRTAAAALVLAGVFVADVRTTAQGAFKSSLDLVTIQASVRDARGRILPGLTSSDFEVWDNGQLRPVLSLRADRESPVSVCILVDMSGSMALSSKIEMARHAFNSVLSQLQEGQDEVALYTFDSSLHERNVFTRDLASVRNGLADFEPFGTTSMYDAAAETSRQLASRTATHKALIVITDGIDTSSSMTATQVSGLASSIDVPVFVIATMAAVDQRMAVEGGRPSRSEAADLRDLTEWTGGRLVFAATPTDALGVATTLIDELRQQYVLAIEAAPTREWRRLDVRVKSKPSVVKARSGYFGG